ncbi:conserved hypothetical protein [Ricinus communis]|uniref:VQ domain-containing protein n=1 Tax=Ricinus communis TaxID=3988 RepID=B9RNS7_RICCO|nr:conserved hypothetical protein [Ricinus communis]|eukprot:XP_002515396.1 VQ motif-containing protein 31 [Ricinus communis]
MERVHMNTMTSPTSPTTFVQADANTFRDLVQKLTGSTGNSSEKLPITLPTRLSSKLSHPVDTTGPRRSPFKLQERRHTIRKLEIKLGLTSSHKPHRVSSTIPSPVTPLSSESLFFRSPGTDQSSSPSSPAVSEEDKAIAEKGFYLHPSPLTTPRGGEPPELLTLFPLSSPSRRNQD